MFDDNPAQVPRPRLVGLGTVIHATLRTQDLIPALLVELRCHNPARAEELSKVVPHEELLQDDGMTLNEDHPWWDSEDAMSLLNEDLFDALDACAPEGVYFGAIEGDGSDFGFWEIPDDG
jgi:hypothetical protein